METSAPDYAGHAFQAAFEFPPGSLVASIPSNNLAAQTMFKAKCGMEIEPRDAYGPIIQFDRLANPSQTELSRNGRPYLKLRCATSRIGNWFSKLARYE